MNSTVYRFFILTLLATFLSHAHAEEFDTDKQLHAGLSFAVYAGTYGLLSRANYNKWDRMTGALVATLAVGLAKEMGDPDFTEADLRADLMGAGAGFTLFFLLDW